jgi:hypothetical protein
VTSTYNGTLPTPQDIDVDNIDIKADHKEAFAFKAPVDDSASAVADMFAQEGVANLLRSAQKYVLSLYSEAGLQVDYDPAADNLSDAISAVAIAMDDAEAPEEGRWIVLPPAEVHEISDDIMQRDTPLGDVAAQRGYQGLYKGFRVFKAPTSHFAGSTYYNAMAGIPTSIAYDDAVLNVRRIPSTQFSGDQVDGLHVGGGKVVRPGQTVNFRITQ